mmetsp:Transcript_57318/g.170940  ORF Transcript_57318/g.170940 Transcript_57318/m.170940 type:complete len:265 (-) Transcript_57318:642-1436(-)
MGDGREEQHRGQFRGSCLSAAAFSPASPLLEDEGTFVAPEPDGRTRTMRCPHLVFTILGSDDDIFLSSSSSSTSILSSPVDFAGIFLSSPSASFFSSSLLSRSAAADVAWGNMTRNAGSSSSSAARAPPSFSLRFPILAVSKLSSQSIPPSPFLLLLSSPLFRPSLSLSSSSLLLLVNQRSVAPLLASRPSTPFLTRRNTSGPTTSLRRRCSSILPTRTFRERGGWGAPPPAPPFAVARAEATSSRDFTADATAAGDVTAASEA